MDEYSDDDLDGLNANVLQELENNAIQFTQARTLAQSQVVPISQGAPLRHDAAYDFEDDDLDDTEVVNGLLGAGAVPASTAVASVANKQHGQRNYHHQGNLPPAPQSYRHAAAVNPRDQFGYTQRVAPPSQAAASYRPNTTQFARPIAPNTRQAFGPGQASQLPTDGGNDIMAALQRRVRALEAELNSAKGEAAIIRSKSTKAEHDHAAEVARLRKQNAEQEAKNQRLVDAAITKEKHATTELEFLQRDMQEATVRAKRKEPADQSFKAPAAGVSTPKRKNKTWAMADGFEDLDMIPSPSKSRGKTRDGGGVAAPLGERTPTRNKRKRPMADSPVMALETHAIDLDISMEEPAVAPETLVVAAPAPAVLPFDFLPLVLDHGLTYGEPPTFDVLSRYAFPSDPGTSFAAFIYQQLPMLGNRHNPMQLLVDFCRLILIMWDKCLAEEYLRPIWDLATLIAFILQLDTQSVAPHIVNELLPVAEQSIYKVADLRYKSADGDLSSDPAADALQQQIDTTYILSIVHLVAMGCVTSVDHADSGVQTRQAEFWRMVPVDLVLMLLTPKQRLADITLMLDLLCTSALPSSLGPLVADRAPELGARMVLERVTANLVEFPKGATTPCQKHTIAQAVLRTLSRFSRSPFGALQIASHVNAIPRLVTMLSALVDELYDMTDPLSAGKRNPKRDAKAGPERVSVDSGDADDADDEDEDGEGLHQLIKQIVALLHALVTGTDTAEAVNIQSKLALAYGGPQRYILALSRIHFAEEDLLYEAGIDESTADMARELCEYVVTPDEGEGVREAFGI